MINIFIDMSGVDISLLDELNISHYDKIKDESNHRSYIEFTNFISIELLAKDDINISKDDISISDKDGNKIKFDYSKWSSHKNMFVFLDEENIEKKSGDTIYLVIGKSCTLHDNTNKQINHELQENTIDEKTEYSVEEIEGISDDVLNKLFRDI